VLNPDGFELSRVPPVWPSPRPLIIGTLIPAGGDDGRENQRSSRSQIPETVESHVYSRVESDTSLILRPSSPPRDKRSDDHGRGNGTGTIDKLESIPGFNTDTLQEFGSKKNALIGQTAEIAPAKKNLRTARAVH